MAGFRAQLSPNEQTTLQRIAPGTLKPGEVREADVDRLMALGLVEMKDGLLVLTGRGLERVQIDKSPPSKPQRGRRRLKSRQIPF